MQKYQKDFLDLALESKALEFGKFTLKSGRILPYFFNLGAFNRGRLLLELARLYANAIIASGIKFDVIFGPAYKGIPLAVITVAKLAETDPEIFGNVEYSFNRKEQKDHGEGGSIVGASLSGKRVLIIDDVMTAGTAIKEAFGIIKSQGGQSVGCIFALDRQETIESSSLSATQAVIMNYEVPVEHIVTLSDMISYLRDKLTPQELECIIKYRTQFAPANE